MEQLTDEELTAELERLGCQSGPITDTTRTVYSRQLQRLSTAATASTDPEDTEDKVAECCNGRTTSKLYVSNSGSGGKDSGGKDIFLSYGHSTVLGVEELKCQLENAGYSVWLDKQDIAGGSDWHCVIGEAVKSCRALIALINSKYLSSVHCKNELYMANSCSKPLLPVLLEGNTIDDPGVQYAISSVNWIKAPHGLSDCVTQQILHSLNTLGIQPLSL